MFAEDGFELGAAEAREHDIELAWGGTIAGHVVDTHGAPVAGAMVSFQAGMTSRCTSDATGAFACSGLAGDKYVPAVSPGSGAANPFRFVEPPAPIELRDGDARIDGVRLVVEPTLLAIEGKVVDGSGDPVPDAVVHAFDFDRNSRATFQPSPAAITDDDGRFHLGELSPGVYAVEVERRGQARRQTVSAGDTNVTLVLDRARCDGAGGHDVPPSLVKPPTAVVWDQKIELVGWSVPSAPKANAAVDVTFVYRALEPVDRDWTMFAHFDSSTLRVNGDHTPGLGWCPTNHWQAGETIVDRTTVRFDHAGRYALTIGFFTGKAPTWENLAVSAAPAAMHDAKQQGVHVADVLVRE
jgi:hypothetical protein